MGGPIKHPPKPEMRAKIIKAQRGVCGSCGKNQRPPARLVIDHSHVSGFVRAAVCEGCNDRIGRAEYIAPAYVTAYLTDERTVEHIRSTV
jgi:hypothetical protein